MKQLVGGTNEFPDKVRLLRDHIWVVQIENKLTITTNLDIIDSTCLYVLDRTVDAQWEVRNSRSYR